MRYHATLSIALTFVLSTSAAFASSHVRRSSAHASLHSVSSHTSRSTSHAKLHRESVRSMDPERATAIQTALIEKGYMSGEPTGTWDANSVAAMQKLQGENGWQTKITPDSRALIKLGLGPQQQTTASLQ